MDYKNHRQNCGKSGQLQNVSNEDLHKKLRDAGKDAITTDHDGKMTTDSEERADGEMTTDSEEQDDGEMTTDSEDADDSNHNDLQSGEMTTDERDVDDSNQPEDDEDEQMDEKI